MHTPFDIIRSKEKHRRSKINQCRSPPIFSFSLKNSRRDYSLQDQNQHQIKTTRAKSHEQKIKRNRNKKRNKIQQEQNYQITIQNTLKKLSLFKSSLKKHHEKDVQMPSPSLSYRNSSKKLIIEGSPCSKELIKSNKKKIQNMIQRIKGNNFTEQAGFKQIPEVMIVKCQLQKIPISRSKAIAHNRIFQFNADSGNKTKAESSARSKQSTNKSHIVQDRQQQEGNKKFNPNEFLICSQIQNKSKYETNLEFVLNNKSIVDYIKNSKKKKSALYQKQKSKDFESKLQFNFYVKSQRKAVCKTCRTQTIKRHESNQKGQRKSIKPSTPGIVFNGVDFQHLKGWQNPSQSIDDQFIAQSNLY